MTDAMTLRAEMAAKGWNSEDRLTEFGWANGPGYSIWFSRSDWHDKNALALTGSFATFHAHDADPANALEAVKRAMNLALQAWDEFPDCPPGQLSSTLIARKPLPPAYGCESLG